MNVKERIKEIKFVLLPLALIVVAGLFLFGQKVLENTKKENVVLKSEARQLKDKIEFNALAGQAPTRSDAVEKSCPTFSKDHEFDFLTKECPFYIEDSLSDENVGYLINGVSYYPLKQNLEKIKAEVKKNRYNMVGGCLYDNGKRAMEYNMLLYYKLGFFNDISDKELNNATSSKKNFGSAEGSREWFRYIDGNTLKIYLDGYAGCGGCVFAGPVLNIDLNSGKISGETKDIPYPLWLVLSPSKKKAIEVAYDYDNSKEVELYLYNFITGERTPIYKIPKNRSVMECSDGCYPGEEMVKWLNENQVQVKFYNMDETLSSDAPVLLKIN